MRRLLPLLLLALALAGCRNEIVSRDPSLSLSFSVDTLSFDTVFSGIGTSTRGVMLRNPHSHAVVIDSLWLDSARFFRVNVDGETDLRRLRSIELRGGDSLFVFVRVCVDTSEPNPVLVRDALRASVNGNTATLALEAYGQHVHLLRSASRRTVFRSDFTFTADEPWLIYDTVYCASDLTINGGATLYMHAGSALVAYGPVLADGTPDTPIRILGDRLDYLFENVPYSCAAGQWGGIYLFRPEGEAPRLYDFRHTEILSGNIGLYAYGEPAEGEPSRLRLDGCRIHNHAVYGVIAVGVNTEIANTEISNAAAYCLYVEGGEHILVHSTVASYFNSTDVRIQSVSRQDVAAVYVNNLNKRYPATSLSLLNCIVTGLRRPELRLATPFERYYDGRIVGCYLLSDSLTVSGARDNVYAASGDTVFRNTFYEYEVYDYYDFRLDSVSPARAIADSAILDSLPSAFPSSLRLSLRTDRLGHPRPSSHADAGCYQSE